MSYTGIHDYETDINEVKKILAAYRLMMCSLEKFDDEIEEMDAILPYIKKLKDALDKLEEEDVFEIQKLKAENEKLKATIKRRDVTINRQKCNLSARRFERKESDMMTAIQITKLKKIRDELKAENYTLRAIIGDEPETLNAILADDECCDGCGTTCLDHTSNKGRGSASPCEMCGENRCKHCPCECDE